MHLETKLETAIDQDLDMLFKKLSNITNTKSEIVIQNEFVRLSKDKIQNRRTIAKNDLIARERVPCSLRKILLELYKGKCQLTDFTFIKKNGKPYFEIHHINPEKGNHFKNLLVVSPNIHKQFEYARKEEFYDNNG